MARKLIFLTDACSVSLSTRSSGGDFLGVGGGTVLGATGVFALGGVPCLAAPGAGVPVSGRFPEPVGGPLILIRILGDACACWGCLRGCG